MEASARMESTHLLVHVYQGLLAQDVKQVRKINTYCGICLETVCIYLLMPLKWDVAPVIS